MYTHANRPIVCAKFMERVRFNGIYLRWFGVNPNLMHVRLTKYFNMMTSGPQLETFNPQILHKVRVGNHTPHQQGAVVDAISQ